MWLRFCAVNICVSIILNSKSVLTVGVKSGTNGNCGLLETTNYHLNFQCIQKPNVQNVIHSVIGTKDECEKACCNWNEGPCDIVYWDQSKTCLIMNYYVTGVCPLLTSTMPQVAANIEPQQYLMLRITKDVNSVLKQHLKAHYQKDIKSLLNCNQKDVLCSNWECIDEKFDCDGKADCSDGSDELCLSSNDTNVLDSPHCVDKDGLIVFPGKYFIRKDMEDPCEKCKCSTDGSFTCFNIQCAIRCINGVKKDACCECADGSGDSYLHMSSTQRLVVSCMSVLAVVSMLLFFSRNILQRRHARANSHILNWIHGRDERYRVPTLEFNERRRLSDLRRAQVMAPDLPPAYVTIKPPSFNGENDGSNSDISNIPPPSYNQVMDGERESSGNNIETTNSHETALEEQNNRAESATSVININQEGNPPDSAAPLLRNDSVP